MKNQAIFIVPVCLVLLFSGCSGLFQVNLFRSFENTDSQISENPSIEEIIEAAENPEFYSDLEEDPEEKARVIGILDGMIETGNTDSEKQKAAIVLAEVYLETDEYASGVTSGVLDAMLPLLTRTGGEGEGTELDLPGIIDDILPAEIKPPSGATSESPEFLSAKAVFITTFTALSNAGDAYNRFGALLASDGSDPATPEGTSLGSVLQRAVVCIFAESVLSSVSSTYSDCTETAAAGILFDYLYGGGPDPLTGYDLDAAFSPDSSLAGILSAMDVPVGSFSTEGDANALSRSQV